MKILHQINICVFTFTLLLYFLVYTALAGIMILAITQFLIAIYTSIKYYKKLDKKNKSHIINYWCLSFFALAGIIASYYYDHFVNDFYAITSLFIFPSAIACYFLYTTYSIKIYLTTHDNNK